MYSDRVQGKMNANNKYHKKNNTTHCYMNAEKSENPKTNGSNFQPQIVRKP